jgi:hypothetical protein
MMLQFRISILSNKKQIKFESLAQNFLFSEFERDKAEAFGQIDLTRSYELQMEE